MSNTLTCPSCGSHNAECVNSAKQHTHICEDCGRRDEYAVPRVTNIRPPKCATFEAPP